MNFWKCTHIHFFIYSIISSQKRIQGYLHNKHPENLSSTGAQHKNGKYNELSKELDLSMSILMILA